MNQTINDHLLSLYGENVARGVEQPLNDLVRKYAAQMPAVAGGNPAGLTERDALLITYADQVSEPGTPPLRTLAEFADRHLTGVVSGIHILPFYPWTSDDGFSVKDYYAVAPEYGTWEDVARLRPRFDLMFDAVFNHMSAQGDWFQRFLRDEPEFRDFFVTVQGNPDLSQVVRPRALPLLTEFKTAHGPERVWTTFSADQVDVNVKNPRMLLALIEALLFYVEHGARFIRLDAIAYLWKEIGTSCIHLSQTHTVIQLMRAVLDKVAPQIQLITETNVPHADNISYFGDGTNEAQLVYNFALPPLVLHSLATGSAEKLTRWAQSLTLPSAQVTFFNFLASHDGIGLNPARGILSPAEIDALVARALAHGGFVSYKHNSDGTKSPYELNVTFFDALSNPAAKEPEATQISRFLVAHAIMLSLAGVPGIYFHSLFGSRNDLAGAKASRIPRRINREKFLRANIEPELANPRSLRSRVFVEMKRLLQLRRAHPAFHPGGRQKILSSDPRVFAVLRVSTDASECVLCLHNVTDATVTTRLPRETNHRWRPLIGTGRVVASNVDGLTFSLAPYEIAWLRADQDIGG